MAVAAWRLYVGALALAPPSVVRAVLSRGLVFLGVLLAERYFDFHLGRRQWVWVIVTAFGLAVIAITGERHTRAVRHYSLAALIAVECGVFALGAAPIGIPMHGSVGPAAQGRGSALRPPPGSSASMRSSRALCWSACTVRTPSPG